MIYFLTPLVLLHLTVFLAIARLWRKDKGCRPRLRWVVGSFLLLTLLNSPPAAFLALGSLERRYPPSKEVPQDAGAIVVLGGLIYPADEVRPQGELGPNTLTRCLHAAGLHRAAPDRPILVSGGVVEEGSPTAAELMTDFFVSQGVKRSSVIVENRSRTTYENAVESCQLLRTRGICRIVLITHASHMPRAAACFRKQGMEVVASPCGHLATQYNLAWSDILPDVKSATQLDEAWHEWLGMAFYRARGRM